MLIEMERSRFIKKQKTAWSSDEILRVKGRVKMQDCFESINAGNYEISKVEFADYTLFTVKKPGKRVVDAKVKIPNVSTRGSRFGTCTCGGPKVLGLPCEHIAAVVKFGVLGVTTTNIMPYWWTIEEMRIQYPMNVEELSPEKITLETIMTNEMMDNSIHHLQSDVRQDVQGRRRE